ncbi:class I SAM-dependent methyltransferase [Pseudomonas putida]|uniref:class I SAM-dependent methyltransferase n=1 Tax=Pseudomonas putida TaxID=303 RepID=UPI002AC6CDD9|nr:class I SAM-dependent methyltransferase [Pseudomonas putida]MDZ5111859.1 class I SAM-dependent methyltransferase [Pseudomonas putida]
MNPQPLLDGIPRRQSALTMALARAVHQLLDEPTLLQDRHAFDILGSNLARQTLVDPYVHNAPMLRTMRAAVVARTRLVEDRVVRAIGTGVRQVVILGAGLDTLFLRIPDNVRCVELDQAQTQQWKLDRLKESGISVPSNVVFLTADLAEAPLMDLLGNHGIDPKLPTIFSCLGVLPYLETSVVSAIIRQVSLYSSQSEIVFDARISREFLSPVEQWMEDMAARSFAAAGEPWLSAFDPAQLMEMLLCNGFCDVECLDAEAINARYFMRRRDGLQAVDGGLRLFTATVG